MHQDLLMVTLHRICRSSSSFSRIEAKVWPMYGEIEVVEHLVFFRDISCNALSEEILYFHCSMRFSNFFKQIFELGCNSCMSWRYQDIRVQPKKFPVISEQVMQDLWLGFNILNVCFCQLSTIANIKRRIRRQGRSQTYILTWYPWVESILWGF